MKIIKLEKTTTIENDKKVDGIMVYLEGHNNQPVFPATITKEELKTQLAEWKANQDKIDAIDVNSDAVEDTEINAKLKALEGKDI